MRSSLQRLFAVRAALKAGLAVSAMLAAAGPVSAIDLDRPDMRGPELGERMERPRGARGRDEPPVRMQREKRRTRNNGQDGNAQTVRRNSARPATASEPAGSVPPVRVTKTVKITPPKPAPVKASLSDGGLRDTLAVPDTETTGSVSREATAPLLDWDGTLAKPMNKGAAKGAGKNASKAQGSIQFRSLSGPARAPAWTPHVPSESASLRVLKRQSKPARGRSSFTVLGGE